MIHKDEILNILTVREALDLKAIDLIPEEDYPRLRDEMKACIAAVRKTDLTNEDMLRHDLEFHNIIRRAANNDILLNICITLTGTIYDERRVLFTHTNYVGAVTLGAQPNRQRLRLARRQSGQAGIHCPPCHDPFEHRTDPAGNLTALCGRFLYSKSSYQFFKKQKTEEPP